ncbi:hypothetical protein ACQEV2_41790 [Streptomyces sp. CA-251387]|uniref:hypothetical protein n=1 Tax=Streptomyces sp. CA-251387 TaxID=3240064 RepID=UPI003D8F8624
MSVAPIGRDVAVVQLKRALPDPVRRIELSDLVGQAVTAVVDASTAERRPLHPPPNAWADTFVDSVRSYRADSDTLLHLLANGVFHDDGTHDQLWQRVVTRLVRLRDTTPSPYNEHLETLRHLPALMATWTIGVGAILSRREDLLADLLTHPAWARPGFGKPRQQPVWYLNPNRVIEREGLNDLYRQKQGNGYLYPQSHWLKEELREPFRLVEPSDHAYLEACTRFEYLTSMIAMDAGHDARAYPWAGEFLLDDIWEYERPDLSSSIEHELTAAWPLLRAGAFGGDVARAKAAHQALAECRAKYPRD